MTLRILGSERLHRDGMAAAVVLEGAFHRAGGGQLL